MNTTRLSNRGRRSPNDRLHLEGIIYILRTGIQWRDLPNYFGKWATVYKRFQRWSASGLWNHLLIRLNDLYTDNEYLMIDSTIMRIHQDGSNPKGGQARQAMGKSRGGLSTKVHMACDALGYPLTCVITGGERADAPQAKTLLKRHLKANGYALLDAGYDSNDIRDIVDKADSQAVIAYRKNRKQIPVFDKHLYKERHKVENLFQKLKRYRRIATRYEKTHHHFKSMVTLASILLYIRF